MVSKPRNSIQDGVLDLQQRCRDSNAELQLRAYFLFGMHPSKLSQSRKEQAMPVVLCLLQINKTSIRQRSISKNEKKQKFRHVEFQNERVAQRNSKNQKKRRQREITHLFQFQ